MAGIKESLEALAAVELGVKDVKAVIADGKVNMSDLPVLFDVIRQLGAFNAGLQGAELIPVEIKDLDAVEAEQLVAAALRIVNAWRGASLKA